MNQKPTWAEVRESLRALDNSFEGFRGRIGFNPWRILFQHVADKSTKLAFVLIAATLFTGCVQTQFTAPNGASFKTTRFLWQGEIGKAELLPDGSASVEAYQSEAAAIAEAVASGVAKGLKP